MTPPARKLTLFALAWPIFGEQLLHVAVGTVDTFMVSHVSDDAVAALGQAGQVVWMAITLFMFVGIGSSIVITHHLGAKDRSGDPRFSRRRLWFWGKLSPQRCESVDRPRREGRSADDPARRRDHDQPETVQEGP